MAEKTQIPHKGVPTRSGTPAAAVTSSNTSQPRSEVGKENFSIYSIPSSLSVPAPDHTLLGYQSRIADVCELKNTLVLVPTRAGKVVIAAEVIKRSRPNALFIVPAQTLVEQQATPLRSWSSRVVVKLEGGAHDEPFDDVLLATAEAFMAAQDGDNDRFGWGRFKVVVFDEAHHVVNDHPYRELSLRLRRRSLSLPASSHAPRVLGLTALCAGDIGEASAYLARICDELLIVNKEMGASGYQDTPAAAEISSRPTPISSPGAQPEGYRTHQQDTTTFLRRGKEIRGNNTNFALWLMAWVCCTVAIGASDAVRLAKLQAVESAARGVLVNFKAKYGLGADVSSNGEPTPPLGAWNAVDLFVARTNAILEKVFQQDPVSRLWVCTLSYESALRKLQVSGEAASGKNTAKRLAAARLVADLFTKYRLDLL